MKRIMTMLTVAGVFVALLAASAIPGVALAPDVAECSASGGSYNFDPPNSRCIITTTTSTNPGTDNPSAAKPKTSKVTKTEEQTGKGGGEKETTSATTTCVGKGNCNPGG